MQGDALPVLNTLIMGISGYAGTELVTYINYHPHMNITALVVSAQSNDAGKLISDPHPQLKDIVDMPLQPMSDIGEFSADADMAFPTTAHKVNHDLAPQFLATGYVVFDLFGALRVNDGAFYKKHYDSAHQYPDPFKQTAYGLVEWSVDVLGEAQLIAVFGYYPTVAQLSLKPLAEVNLPGLSQQPVVNATSEVSDTGRKATVDDSLYEIGLQPYGIFNHHHQSEITSHLGAKVILTPHLGNFKRGVLETIACRLKPGIGHAQIVVVYQKTCTDKPLVRLHNKSVPTLKSVEGLSFYDVGFTVQGDRPIVVAAEGNLLRGAATQAVQCANIRFGFAETQFLI